MMTNKKHCCINGQDRGTILLLKIQMLYIYVYKGSAWLPAFAGTHAPRKAEGSTSTCSIQYSIK